jgi:hypothetical protein
MEGILATIVRPRSCMDRCQPESGRKDARLSKDYAATGDFAGFSIGTPTTEPYSVQLPS